MTQSTNMADSMTLHMERLFPRDRSKRWLYEWILDLKDVRLTPEMIVPPLSGREEEYIKQMSNLMIDMHGNEYFITDLYEVDGTILKKLPWECGFMSAHINHTSIYKQLADDLGRYVILGPSGTLEFMLNVAEIFGVDLKIMTLACITWMYVARDHSLFEMMIVANQYFEPPLFKFESARKPKEPKEETDSERRQRYKLGLEADRQQLIDLLLQVDPSANKCSKEVGLQSEIGYLEFIHGFGVGLDLPIVQEGVAQIGGEVCQPINIPLKNLIDEMAELMEIAATKNAKTPPIDEQKMITITNPSCITTCIQKGCTPDQKQNIFYKFPLNNALVEKVEQEEDLQTFAEKVRYFTPNEKMQWDQPWSSFPTPRHLDEESDDNNYDLIATMNEEAFKGARILTLTTKLSPPQNKVIPPKYEPYEYIADKVHGELKKATIGANPH